MVSGFPPLWVEKLKGVVSATPQNLEIDSSHHEEDHPLAVTVRCRLLRFRPL